jgi:hypothetical protein
LTDGLCDGLREGTSLALTDGLCVGVEGDELAVGEKVGEAVELAVAVARNSDNRTGSPYISRR